MNESRGNQPNGSVHGAAGPGPTPMQPATPPPMPGVAYAQPSPQPMTPMVQPAMGQPPAVQSPGHSAPAAQTGLGSPAVDLSTRMSALSSELVQDLQIRLDGPIEQQIRQVLGELDMSNTNSIIFFGSKAQQQLATISEQMLERVRTKDVGPAGDLLNSMVQRLRDLDVPDVKPGEKPGILQRLFGIKSEIEKFLDRYDDVKGQIETITNDMERHKTTLLTDITYLDKLYDANLDYFRTLEIYIAAGRAQLKELDERILPQLAQQIEASQSIIEAQKLRDIRAARDDLERRVHDLLLTRQVTMQSLPSIRLVQENNKSLVTKINSTVANTVPLWKQQLAQAVTIFRSGKAAQAVKAAADLTNELLKSNAENLQTTNQIVREQVERGVFDIETVKEANRKLIATIEDSLRIADEGKRKRAQAEQDLIKLEDELKQALTSAASRAQAQAPGVRPALR